MFKKHQSLIFAIIIPPLTLLIVLGFDATSIGQRMENVTVDARFHARADSDPQADPRILFVGIQEQGLEQWGQWPWPRNTHGDLMSMLSMRLPKAVAWDILFTEPAQNAEEDIGFRDGLEALAGGSVAITAASSEAEGKPSPGAILGNTPELTNIKGDKSKIYGKDKILMPTAVLAQSSMIGFVNADPSSVDNIRRKLPVIVRVGTNVYPSLVLQMLMRNELLGPDAIEIVLGEHIKVNGEKESWTIPIDEHGLMEINYRGGNSLENDAFGGVNSISYFGLASHLAQTAGKLKLQSMVPISDEDWPSGYPNPDDPSKEIAIPPVKDQFLIIGQNAAGLTDFGPTPMGSQTPLVKVHATALNNILQSDYISRPSTALWIFIWLSIGWASVVLLRETAVWLSISVPVVMAAAYVGGAFWFFSSQSLHIPIVWPVLGIFVAHGASITRRLIVESKAKGQIKAMFSTYVAPDVVNSLIEAGVAPKLGGEETEITAFFSDIQAFSSFSEKLTPERLVALMNEYLSDMSSILKNKGTGTLDKFIGDAIVGIFGAPLHYADHAYKGCRTAIDIQRRQAELREKWKSEPDWPEIVHGMQTRIGLNSGPAVVGNMGAVDQMNYTMMGDTVNLAARCESGAKSYGVFNMISGETKDAAIKHGKDDIAYRYLDRIVVKGRTQPVEMYEIVEFKKDLIPSASECLELFENGIKKYLAQDWDGAKALFEKSEPLEIYRPGMPGVGSNASLVLIDRCVAMKASPPAADWDGVFVMTTK